MLFRSVLGFLGGMDNPQVVRQSEINRILGTAEETTIESVELNIPYSVDETVKVIDGPFSANDLGADSLDTVELLLEFEKVFDIKIPDEETSTISTVKDAIDKVSEKLQAK